MAWMDGWMSRTEAAAEGGAHLRVQRRARHVGDAQGRHTTTHHRRQGRGDAAGLEGRRCRCLETAGVLLLRALMSSGPRTHRAEQLCSVDSD